MRWFSNINLNIYVCHSCTVTVEANEESYPVAGTVLRCKAKVCLHCKDCPQKVYLCSCKVFNLCCCDSPWAKVFCCKNWLHLESRENLLSVATEHLLSSEYVNVYFLENSDWKWNCCICLVMIDFVLAHSPESKEK